VLSNLIDSDHSQKDLWSEMPLKQYQLSNVMDEINDRYDKFSLRIATQPIKPLWGMKQTLKTQSFTTSWHELLTVS
jgi:DNA polymerase V